MPSKNRRFLSFQVFRQSAIGIIFQTPKPQHFFILLLQATNPSLTFKDYTQLTPIKERAKCQSEETHQECTRRWCTDCSSARHIEHLLGPWKFLLFKKVLCCNFFSLVAAKQKTTLSGDLLNNKWHLQET